MYPEKSLTALWYLRTQNLFIETTSIDEKRTTERDQHGSEQSRLDSTTSMTYAFRNAACIMESFHKYLHFDWLSLCLLNSIRWAREQVDYGRSSSWRISFMHDHGRGPRANENDNSLHVFYPVAKSN